MPNLRVDLHAIDATPARWRGDAGSSPLDGARTAASSPRNDLVKNCRVRPTHWLISTQVLPGERPVSPERINAMEHILLNAVGFDLYVPQDQYEDCVAELCGVVRSHAAARPDLPVLLQRHAEFLTTQAARLPWTTPP